MFKLYSFLYTVAFLLMLPVFLLSFIFRTKHAAGFFQRLGFLPKFNKDHRPVVWLHCVSVGETNAARPLVDAIRRDLPEHRLIVSTVTRTGQKLAREIYGHRADCVFYVPFDWALTVRRALRHFSPSVLLLMETEIWFNLIRETSRSKCRIAIVNGRLSERSFKRYGYLKNTMKRILGYLQIALMQSNVDANRIMSLGLRASKVKVSGNLKFDHDVEPIESDLVAAFRQRFAITPDVPLIIAASTHEPEERLVIEAFKKVWKSSQSTLPRLMIVPRHPERFDAVAELMRKSGFNWVRRTEKESGRDKTAEIILLDTIGELRAIYPLAEVVFVGGSLIPHGGQSIFEPAAAGRAIITGPYTSNFEAAVKEFAARDAIRQINATKEAAIIDELAEAMAVLVADSAGRKYLGNNALAAMNANRGAADKTIEYIRPLIASAQGRMP